ncbi:MAG: TIGR01777 family oxidoreductase [Phycisphaerales bacterium]
MRILVSGSTGLIGQAVCMALAKRGHVVRRLVRHSMDGSRMPVGTAVVWKPSRGEVPLELLEGLDVVIHLAGEPVFGRWTDAKRRRILESRVGPTTLLAGALTKLVNPPRLFLTASATGYYGTHTEGAADESAKSGGGFLAEVCRRWEAAGQVAAQRGIAVGHLRFGMVLSRYGGALKRMLPIFKMGLGGRLGGGEQYWPWISIDDAAAAIAAIAESPAARGPYNIVAPQCVTHAQFTRELAGRLHRPACLPVPATLLTLVLPGLAQETLLASQEVVPGKLEAMGFEFAYPTLEGALKELIWDFGLRIADLGLEERHNPRSAIRNPKFTFRCGPS